MGSLRVGILGAGAIAMDHAKCLSLNPGVGKLLVFDVDGARAAKLAQEYKAEAVTSEAALIAGSDLVWICSPPAYHRATIEACAAARKPMFCEKPLALSEADLAAIERAVAQSGTTFLMGQSCRWLHPFQVLVNRARSGAVGEIIEVFSTRLGYFDPARHPAWRLTDAASGGVVVELGVHEIDFLRSVAGNVVSVHGVGSSKNLARDRYQDNVAATGWMSNGAALALALSACEPRYLWQRGVRGTEGTLFIDDSRLTKLELWRPGKPEPELIPCENWRHETTGENMAFRNQVAAAVATLSSGVPFPVTVADGAAAVRAALAIRESITTGRAIKLA
jgi:predicted dehydrogenase